MNSNCPRLIEVALPIREISAESVRDKSLRHGHISTLHLWWARRPLAAARAVVFASLVPDPDHPDCPIQFRRAVLRLLKDQVPQELQAYLRGNKLIRSTDPYRPYNEMMDTPRNRLLMFIARWSPEWLAYERGETTKQPKPSELLDDRSLIKWETSNPQNKLGNVVLNVARELLYVATGGRPPVLFDPFSGGGTIPLEASRLGCQAIANDYNPVAYLILRASCEFPQKFGKPGLRMIERHDYGKTYQEEVSVNNVLANDVESWAKHILEHTRMRIGHLYPSGSDGYPVVGYLWARTVPCSNPSCRAKIPMLRTLLICDKSDKKVALTYRKQGKDITFGVAFGSEIVDTEATMIGGGDCRCLICGQVTPVEDVRRAGMAGLMGEKMLAVITDTPRGKGYRAVEAIDITAKENADKLSAKFERPSEIIVPEINGPYASPDSGSHRSISVDIYGLKTFGDLYNSRQILAMQTFVESFNEVSPLLAKTYPDKNYVEAISVYLGLWISRLSQRLNTVCFWDLGYEKINNAFGRQAIPMTWDYCEGNILSESTGSAIGQLEWIISYINHEMSNSSTIYPASVLLGDASSTDLASNSADIVVTDPPYFDAIAYADLSDFFYIWLKRVLSNLLPETFATPQTPKTEEAVAHKHRHHGNRKKGKEHFENKLAECFVNTKRIIKDHGITAIMFAHQSTEAWSALINALLNAGLTVTATYPIDTELITALKRNVAALASSITVICRPRETGQIAALREVRQEIDKVVATSVRRFWGYGFRGADLIVACYGPAVGVFGKYEHVERADGNIVTIPDLLEMVRQSALKAIAGEFTGDSLSRLYFVWANLYGISEQSWDDARLVIQIGGDSEDAMQTARHHELFVVDGPTCRLALLRDRLSQKHLGEETDSPLIDQLHHSMVLWKQEQRSELVQYLKTNNIAEHEPFWKLAQALFEVLPRGEEDWKLISALLGERETLKQEVRQAEPPKGPEQLSLI